MTPDLAIEDGTSTDYFKFTVPEGVRLNIEVAPVGSNYRVKPNPCSCAFEIVRGPSIHDLAFHVTDTDGSTLLASVNERPAGKIENLVLCGPSSFYSLKSDFVPNFLIDPSDLFFFQPRWYSEDFTLEDQLADINGDNVPNPSRGRP